MTASGKMRSGLRGLAAHVSRAFFAATHSGFALIGLAVVFAALALLARPELRQSGEALLIGWLQARQSQLAQLSALTGRPDAPDTPDTPAAGAAAAAAAAPGDQGAAPDASERATAANPGDLPRAQAAVAFWLSKKYRVAPEPLSVLVAEAWNAGAHARIDPTLILAVMAIESSFNPFAQSAVGAQGLMQVMTQVHTDKYQSLGGQFAAFDPVSNLRVGVKVLQECIARAGSLEGGLRQYVGGSNLADDGGYAAKVLAEQWRLRQVADGRAVPIQTTAPAPLQSIPTAAPADAALVLPQQAGA